MNELTIYTNGKYKVDSVYQWDLNQQLKICGVNIQNPEIHFTNAEMVRSIVGKSWIDNAYVIYADIPNSLLQSSSPVIVYICGYEGDTFKTYYKIEIPVIARTKPADYNLSVDEEVYSFIEMSKRITELENSLNMNGNNLYYSYTYDTENNSLVENTANINALSYVKLLNTTVKAFKSAFDALKNLISTNKKTATDALTIAKSKTTTLTFPTWAEMIAHLSNAENKKTYNLGDIVRFADDTLYDYKISALLETADPDTTLFYTLTPVFAKIVNPNDLYKWLELVVLWENPAPTAEFAEQTIELDLKDYKRFVIWFGNDNYIFYDKNINLTAGTGTLYTRSVLITDTGITIGNYKYNNSSSSNTNMIPKKIAGHKF